MATKYMQLDLPVPGITKGPTWALMINEVFKQIDEHDHTSGSGKAINSTVISVTGDFDFTPSTDAYGVKNSKYFQFSDLVSQGTPDEAGALFNWKGDLWWQYNSTGTGVGTFVQLTAYDSVYSTSCSFEPVNVSSSSYNLTSLEKVSAIFVDSQPTTISLAYTSTMGNGRYFLIQDVGGNASTNNITITPQSTNSIGTATAGTSVTISTNYGFKWLVSDYFNDRWLILTEA